MLKMSASGVLASLRGSPYGAEYDSPLRSLWPCRTAILSILRGYLMSPQPSRSAIASEVNMSYSASC